jgi:hypothetical protein
LEVEISTCGVPKPTKLIADVIERCNADFIQVDYRVRGISWSEDGQPVLANHVLNVEDLDQVLLELPEYKLIHSSNNSARSSYMELMRRKLNSNVEEIIQRMLL